MKSHEHLWGDLAADGMADPPRSEECRRLGELAFGNRVPHENDVDRLATRKQAGVFFLVVLEERPIAAQPLIRRRRSCAMHWMARRTGKADSHLQQLATTDIANGFHSSLAVAICLKTTVDGTSEASCG